MRRIWLVVKELSRWRGSWCSTSRTLRRASVYVREVLVRYRLRRVAGNRVDLPGKLVTPRDVARLLVPVLGHEIIEVAGLLCLSVRSELLAYHELSRGTLDSTMVSPRDVF